MDTRTLIVNDYVSLNKAITSEEGQKINDVIRKEFKDGKSVVLDFSGIEIATTAFLNVVIGTLYDTYKSADLQGLLSFVNYSDATASRIKKVTKNAKLFYQNKEQFTKNVEEVMHGDD